MLVVPRGRGGCGGRPVRVGHVSGRNDSVRILTWTIEIGIYNTVLILTSLGSAVSSMSVPAAVCL